MSLCLASFYLSLYQSKVDLSGILVRYFGFEFIDRDIGELFHQPEFKNIYISLYKLFELYISRYTAIENN